MRVRVIKQFKDKYTKLLRRVGEEFEVTPERFEEMNSTALGIFVKELEEEPPTEPPEDSLIDFSSMTKAQLIKYAAGQGIELNMEMTKNAMIESLLKKAGG